ncbi:hypothetical protein D9M72_513810 [compost metagenome]
MAHRHGVAVYRAGLAAAAFFRCQMGHDLVAVEVEVDPVFRAAAFRAAQQFAVELARTGDAVDREGQVERGQDCSGFAHGVEIPGNGFVVRSCGALQRATLEPESMHGQELIKAIYF